MKKDQLCMNIAKIFNWTQVINKNKFNLYFYSLLTNQLIIQKVVQGTLQGNMLHLNCLLKIEYTSDQQQILLKVKVGDKEIGQFNINLGVLKDKKIQYFPFGQRDKVLQINLNPQSNQQTKQTKKHEVNYQNYIKDKQKRVKNILVKRYYPENKYLEKGPKSDQRQLFQQNHLYSNYYKQKNFNPPQQTQNNQYYGQKKYERLQNKYIYQQYKSGETQALKCIKSKSEQAFNNKQRLSSKIQQNESSSKQDKSSRSSQNKLILNTLHIVPSNYLSNQINNKKQMQIDRLKNNIEIYEKGQRKFITQERYSIDNVQRQNKQYMKPVNNYHKKFK